MNTLYLCKLRLQIASLGTAIVLFFLVNIPQPLFGRTASDPSNEDVQNLIDQLDSKYLRERRQAREQLMEKGEQVIPPLLKALKKNNFRVRTNILRIFGHIGDDRSLSALIKFLQSHDPNVQKAASQAIIRFGTDAFRAIEQKLQDAPADSRLQKQYKDLLRRKVEEELLDEITPGGGIGFYDGQFQTLKKLGDRTIGILKEIATGEYDFMNPLPKYIRESQLLRNHLKVLAIRAIGIIGSEKQLPFLKKHFNVKNSVHEIDNISQNAAYSMYRLGYKKPIDKIRTLLERKTNNTPEGPPGLMRRVQRRWMRKLGNVYSLLGENKKALQTYRKLLGLMGSSGGRKQVSESNNKIIWYNMACTYARMDKVDKALNALQKSVDKGYTDYHWMQKDQDLDPLRDRDEFQMLIKKLKNQ